MKRTKTMTKKKWYTKIASKEQGPFSFEELKKQDWLTPDTLVREENSKQWVPLSQAPGLESFFEDDLKIEDEEEENSFKSSEQYALHEDSEIALNLLTPNPYFFLLWLLFVALVLTYIFYQLNQIL